MQNHSYRCQLHPSTYRVHISIHPAEWTAVINYYVPYLATIES